MSVFLISTGHTVSFFCTFLQRLGGKRFSGYTSGREQFQARLGRCVLSPVMVSGD